MQDDTSLSASDAVLWKTRMQAPPENTIALRPVMDELPRLITWLEAFVEAKELPPADSMALELCSEELFTNTVRHGKTSADATSVEFALERKGDVLQLLYSDAGVPFDSAAAAGSAPSHEGADVATKAPGGLGLHFLARTMREIRYERRDDRNVLTMERVLGLGKLAR